MTPLKSETSKVKPSTRKFNVATGGAFGPPPTGSKERSRSLAQSATRNPTTPPTNERTRLSVRSCLISLARPRSQREPHCDLFTAGRARQQQVGDVGAGDQQDQSDDRHHHSRSEQQLARAVRVNSGLEQRNDFRAAPFVVFRKGLRQLAGEILSEA